MMVAGDDDNDVNDDGAMGNKVDDDGDGATGDDDDNDDDDDDDDDDDYDYDDGDGAMGSGATGYDDNDDEDGATKTPTMRTMATAPRRQCDGRRRDGIRQR